MSHPGPKKNLKLLSATNNSNISSANGGMLSHIGPLGGGGVTKGICISGEVSYNNTPKSCSASIMNNDNMIARVLNMNNISSMTICDNKSGSK
jgi:hypothetical protein